MVWWLQYRHHKDKLTHLLCHSQCQTVSECGIEVAEGERHSLEYHLAFQINVSLLLSTPAHREIILGKVFSFSIFARCREGEGKREFFTTTMAMIHNHLTTPTHTALLQTASLLIISWLGSSSQSSEEVASYLGSFPLPHYLQRGGGVFMHF